MPLSVHVPGDERAFRRNLQAKESWLIERARGGARDVRVIVAYPNRYWLAMSNLGFQAVHRLLLDEPRFSVERAYLPDSDGGAIRTFESNRTLAEAEILALSVSFETDYPHVLRMLEAAGVDLTRRESGGIRPLVIGGGAALTLNPEPLAYFFDAIVVGEGEEVLGEIAATYLRWRDERRDFPTLLEQLSEIEGVYVPSLYDVRYREDGTVDSYSVRAPAQARVRRRYVADLDRFPTHTTIQTPETEFRSMFMAETGRGCEVGCKFCVAGYMYRPIRKRSEKAIGETVQIGFEASDAIGFVGAAVSSHPAIARLAHGVAEKGKRASLSSIMSQRVTPELAASLSESEYKTVALAPEAGSEALRFRIGKRVCDEQVVSAVGILAENGIRHFKLYFMVGLPSEEESDVEAIPALVRLAQAEALRAARSQGDLRVAPTLLLSVNPFIPKAWTPFQWHPLLEARELKRRLRVVRDEIGDIPNVEMKFESPRESYFQALLSRGDRRVGELLVALHTAGRDWRWLVQHGSEEIVAGVPPADFYVYRQYGSEERLPWEIIDMRIKRDLLEREYQRTFTADVEPLRERARREYLREAA